MVALGLTIPTDERFLDTIKDVTSRVAEYVGFPKAEAQRMAETIQRAVTTLVQATSPQETRNSVSLSFSTVSDDFRVRIQFRTIDGTPQVTPGVLEDGLSQNGAGGPALQAIRAVVDRVEFVEDEGIAYCHLYRRLPSNS
jgi:anti-sigma regulatory factor (Ser/Thr protein kinase)